MSSEPNTEYIITPTAYKFINDWEHPVNILAGPMFLGKGAATAIKLFQYAFFRAPLVNGVRTSKFLGVRTDYDAFRETTLEEIYKWFPPNCVHPPRGQVNKQTTEVKIRAPKTDSAYGVDCKIILVSMKNFNPNDLLSYNVTGMIWSELQENEDFDIFTTIYDRTGRFPYKDQKMFFGDINYPDDDHWIYEKFITDKENTENNLRWKIHKIPPVFHLDEYNNYVENPDAELPMHEKDYDYWRDIVYRGNESDIRVKVVGDFAIQNKGTPVYPDFNDGMIVKTKPIQGKPLLFGIDPGNRSNLGIVIGQLDLSGKLRILGCISPKAYMDFDKVAEDLLMPLISTEIYPHMCPNGGTIETYGWRDPSDAEDKHTNKNTGDVIKEKTGINTVKCSTNNISLRTNAVHQRIRRGMIEVDERAVDVIKGFKGGYYIDKHGKPDKGRYSHIMNALEYLCYGIDNGYMNRDSNEPLPVLFN